MHLPSKQKRSHAIPEQLSLPLDYSLSERAFPFQNHGRSIGKRAQQRLARLATSPTKLAQHAIVLVSSENNSANDFIRQRQRFTLTPTLSTLITNVNGNRWLGHDAALPSFPRRSHALIGKSRPHEQRRSSRRLPPNPLGVHSGRAGLPVLRLSRHQFL
jgi:hypothetical protein